ncbi:unnamed protein product [Pleuronectes platessa]|uniref:Uncharacterized protein n=1 Tax=Pleuronectes platessa TaxID=8262 RepID=A0A9N7YVA7_PLEPL|nr:unnamed protein product [Pleuronectes platessa]
MKYQERASESRDTVKAERVLVEQPLSDRLLLNYGNSENQSFSGLSCSEISASASSSEQKLQLVCSRRNSHTSDSVMADQKMRTFSTVTSPDKGGATIRIMPGHGVIPQKQGQTISTTTTTGSEPITATTCANVVTMAASVVAGAKGITVNPRILLFTSDVRNSYGH